MKRTSGTQAHRMNWSIIASLSALKRSALHYLFQVLSQTPDSDPFIEEAHVDVGFALRSINLESTLSRWLPLEILFFWLLLREVCHV